MKSDPKNRRSQDAARIAAVPVSYKPPMESSGPRYGPARGGQPYRDDRGGSRGGYQGDRGGYQGDRGGYQGDRGGYQGDRGGYQGDRGGYQGDRGGYQGDRGGNQRPYDSSQGPRDAQRFERAPDRDGADLPEAEPRASVTPEGGTGLAPPLAVLLAAAARELVLTLSVDAEADLEPGEGPTEAEGADDAASTEVTAGAESVEGHGSADAESPQAQAVTADASRDRVGASAQSDAAPSEPAADAATDASDFAHATQDAESSEGEPQDAPAAYRSPSTPPEPIRSVLHQLDPISRRAVQDIRYEGLRHFGLTQVIVNQWGRQHPPLAVEALVAVALGQLDSGRRPAHTVVSQAVDACDLVPGCDWARGFVNAMLRRVLRETRQVEYWMANEPVARFNAPDEWIDRLAQRLGPLAERALDGSTLRAPMTLRVNRRAMARKQGRASMSASDAAHAYRGMLYQAGIGADLTAVYGGKKSRFEVPAAIRLRQPVGVSHLPGFAEGLVSVQDAAAQLAAELLQVERGQRVLDACAAPGGKTCHLLESADCEVTAVDVSAARLAMVADNLKRLGLEATLIEGDAAKPEAWWDGQPFDRILLDAPCTASGVVRRHPEIPWIRQQAAIERVAALQLTMLGQLWPLLKPGGVMLFVTCSILPDEGERQVRRFAERQTDVEILPSPGLLVPQQRGEADHDGFFYALLRKPA